MQCFDTHFCVVDVVNLVKYDKFHVPNKVCAFVQHTTQNFCRHNETACLGIDLNIACQDSYRRGRKGEFEVPELLIGKRLNGGRINGPGLEVRIKAIESEAFYLVICLAASAMAYSATTVFPAEV